jgi:hypothetical protein
MVSTIVQNWSTPSIVGIRPAWKLSRHKLPSTPMEQYGRICPIADIYNQTLDSAHQEAPTGGGRETTLTYEIAVREPIQRQQIDIIAGRRHYGAIAAANSAADTP